MTAETPKPLIHEDRRAAALRENLLKRKNQSRERQQDTNKKEDKHVPDA